MSYGRWADPPDDEDKTNVPEYDRSRKVMVYAFPDGMIAEFHSRETKNPWRLLDQNQNELGRFQVYKDLIRTRKQLRRSPSETSVAR